MLCLRVSRLVLERSGKQKNLCCTRLCGNLKKSAELKRGHRGGNAASSEAGHVSVIHSSFFPQRSGTRKRHSLILLCFCVAIILKSSCNHVLAFRSKQKILCHARPAVNRTYCRAKARPPRRRSRPQRSGTQSVLCSCLRIRDCNKIEGSCNHVLAFRSKQKILCHARPAVNRTYCRA